MTCSRKFDRLLRAASLGLVGILTAAGCGGSSGGGANKDASPDGPVGPRPDVLPADVTPPVVVTASPLILDLGGVDVGQTSSVLASVTVTNLGPATSLSPEIVPNPSPFSLAGNTCNTLPVNGTCIISVVFTPDRTGPASATLVVAGTVKVSLVGTGNPAADFTQTDHIDLGTLLVGASAAGKVTVTATNALNDLLCSVTAGGNIKPDPTTTTCPTAAVGQLAKSASCFVGFTFSSITAGAKTGDQVICSAGKVTKTTSITALVVTGSKLVISPAAPQTAATTGKSNTVTVTVANGGGSPTGAIAAAITPANPEFSVTGTTCAVGLLPQGTCTVTVTFSPLTDGTKTATLVVTDANAPTTPATATVTGVATGPSNLVITGGPDLGTVALGEVGTPVTFTVKNTGGTDATGLVVTSNNPAFVLGNDGCTGQTLVKTTGTCTVTLTFAPSATGLPGAYNGLLTASSAGGNPFNLPITATATKPAVLIAVPNPLAFEGIALNTQSGDGVLTITNTGGATTGALSIPSALGNGFVISGNTCSAPLLPTQTCTMSIRYTPGAITQSTWSFTVSSASGASVVISLTGTGKQPNVLDISPRDVKGCGELRALADTHAAVSVPAPGPGGGSVSVQCFEDTAMGQADGSFPKTPVGTSAPVTFIIQNSNVATAGGINLESGVVTVTIGGTNAADFVKVSTTCGPSLQPGQTCMYVVSFKPSAPGLRVAMISVTSANGGNAGTNMEGIGLPPIEIQPCGYSDYSPATAGKAPTGVTLGTGAKLACIDKLAKSAVDDSDRTGLDFGQVSLGANCNPMNVKWYLVTINSSTAADNMNLITAVLTDAATPSNFRIANVGNLDQCNNTNRDVSKGPAWCWISVEFMPQGTVVGAKTASVAATGGSGGSASVNLTGTAVGPLTIKPATAEFGTVVVNEAASTTVTLTVMNWSTTNTLGPVMASLSGAAAADFRVVYDTCTDYYPPDPNYPADPNHPGLPPQTVDPATGTAACSDTGNNTCLVGYRFFPKAVGNRTATFTVTAGTASSTATLHGTGVAETTISATPTTVGFGSIVLSNKSDWQTVTVNAGAGGVETGTLEFGLVGSQKLEFEIATGLDAGTCGNTDTMRLGGTNPMSCTVKVRFIPGVKDGLGVNKATLVIVDPRDRTLTQNIILTGTGITQLTITPTAGDFGLMAAGEPVDTRLTFTVSNRGTAAINSPILTVELPFLWAPSGGTTDCPNGSGTIAGTVGTCIVVVSMGPHGTPGLISVTPGVLITGATGIADPNMNESRAAAQLTGTIQSDAVLELVGLSRTDPNVPTTGTIDLGMAASGSTGGQATLLFRNTGGHDTSPIHYYFYADPNAPVAGSVDQDPNDFYVVKGDPSADSCLGKSLKGGQYCMVNVAFKPANIGDKYAGFALKADIGGSTTNQALVSFKGHGRDTASEKLIITPSFVSMIGTPVSVSLTLNSPVTPANEENTLAATSFNILNNFTTTLTLSIAVTPPFVNAETPTGASACTGTLGPGASCLYWVKFLPQSATPTDFAFVPGSITVTASGANTATAGMMGKVRNGTVLSVWNQFTGTDRCYGDTFCSAFDVVNFGSVARQLGSAPMPFTVMNIGDAATSGNASVKIIGTGPVAQFSATGCGSALAAFSPTAPSSAATCAAQVVLTPSSATVGQVVTSGSVQLEAYANRTTWNGLAGTTIDATGFAGSSYPMNGTCINPAALVITPTGTVAFPDITPVLTESAELFFTITNGAANTTLTIPDFQTSSAVGIGLKEGGADSTNFRLDLDPNIPLATLTTCEQSKDQVTGNLILLGNQQCTIGVAFGPQAMPASGAAFSAVLSATATTGGTSSVTLNATGRDDLSVTKIGGVAVTDPTTAVVAFSPPSVASGSVSVENGIDVLITNGGLYSTGLMGTVVTGEFFVESDSCQGISLDPGETCDVVLQFAPVSAGAKKGTLTVSATPGGSASVPLTGTGI